MPGPSLQFGEEEATQVLRAYGLRLIALERIWKGTISQNFRVRTDVGPIFLRVSPGRAVADAEFETRLIWHLLSHGLRTPALYQAHNRQGFVTVPGRLKGQVAGLAMVYEWVDGYELTDAEYDERHAHEVGQLLGQLHLCTATLPVRREGIYTLSHLQQRLTKLRRHPRWTDDLLPLLERLSQEADGLARQRFVALPSGVGHCDLFPDNVLFPSARCMRRARARSEQGPWMIDLEQAAWTTLIYDLAVSLLACAAPLPQMNAAAKGGAEEPKRCGPMLSSTARALVAGYQRMRLLTDAEWTALPEMLRLACVRFTTTRLTDVHLRASIDQDGETSVEPKESSDERKTRRSAGKVHSKDYRDYVYRLDRLKEISPEELIHGLR